MQQTVLVQTLIVRRGKVLLGRWRSGAFADRLTGMIGQASVPPGGKPPSPEEVGARTCRQLLGDGADVDGRRLSRRGFFTFEERDSRGAAAAALGEAYGEHQLLLRLGPEEETLRPVATEHFEPAGWFGPEELPFAEMPQDDKVWYHDVLFRGKLLRGNFVFDDKDLVEHALEEVQPAEGLCGNGLAAAGQPLLLHNPACSKSRALREALLARGGPFMERNYLEEPLTLSELETLAARLQAGSEEFCPELLCRDTAAAARCRGAAAAAGEPEPGRRASDLLLEHLALEPQHLQRPVLVHGLRAALGRPSPEDALRVLQSA